MEDPLLGDDPADQKSNEQNDRHRLPGDAIEVMHHRYPSSRTREGARYGIPDLAEHSDERQEILRGVRRAASERFGACEQSVSMRCGVRLAAIGLAHFVEKPLIVFGNADEVRLAAFDGSGAQELFKQPGAERIELPDTGEVDLRSASAGDILRKWPDQRLKLGSMPRGPRARGGELNLPAGVPSGEKRLCHRRFSIARVVQLLKREVVARMLICLNRAYFGVLYQSDGAGASNP
jgi:hypothetical protein